MDVDELYEQRDAAFQRQDWAEQARLQALIDDHQAARWELKVGLLACWCPVPDATISPLMQGQAAVAARYELNKAAHAADALKHDYITFKGH